MSKIRRNAVQTTPKAAHQAELNAASLEELRAGLLLAVRDMGNPDWSDSEVAGNALSYVKAAKR